MSTKTKAEKKVKKRRNPNPNTSGLKKIPKIAPEGSAPRAVSVRVPASQYDIWMSLPAKERNECLRKAIADRLIERNLLQTPSS